MVLRIRKRIWRLSLLVKRHLILLLIWLTKLCKLTAQVYVIWIHLHLWGHIIVIDNVVCVIIGHIYHIYLSVSLRRWRVNLLFLWAFFLFLLNFVQNRLLVVIMGELSTVLSFYLIINFEIKNLRWRLRWAWGVLLINLGIIGLWDIIWQILRIFN